MKVNTPGRDKVVVAGYVAHSIAAADFNDDIWAHCKPVTIAHHWSGNEAPTSRHAEAQICWTPEALNVRFVCEQHEPLIVASNPLTDRKTLGLWDRDVCELFLAPDPENPARYFEFEAAPTGEWIDLGIVITSAGRVTDWGFSSGMSAAARIEPQRVLVAMRIPWSSQIPRPDAGSQWRANLFRCVGPDAADRYLAWLPTRTPEPNFHVPDAFGWLEFE